MPGGLQMPHQHMACPGGGSSPASRQAGAALLPGEGASFTSLGFPGGDTGTEGWSRLRCPFPPAPLPCKHCWGTLGFAGGERPCLENPPRASIQRTVKKQLGVEENIRQTSAGRWERMQKPTKNRNVSAAARGGATCCHQRGASSPSTPQGAIAPAATELFRETHEPSDASFPLLFFPVIC